MKSVLAPCNKGGKIRQKYQNMESESHEPESVEQCNISTAAAMF